MNKHLRNALQNLAILFLCVSALFLISRLPLFHTSWAVQVQSLLTPRPADGDPAQAGGPEEMFPAVHVMVTSDIAYGRYGQLHVSGEDPLLVQIIPLFQEALGSATELGAAADKTLRDALEEPGLYLDLTSQLPLEVAAAWLGEEAALERDVRSMALTCEEEDAVLYLRSEAGEVFRYATALPASAVREVCAGLSPNGSTFAYETNYAPLAPYTVLVAAAEDAPVVRGELPAAYSVYNLLTALDFNPHTVFRYTESSGAEVVEESPRTLRIGPAGCLGSGGGPHRGGRRVAAAPADGGGAGGRLDHPLPLSAPGAPGLLLRRERRPVRHGQRRDDHRLLLPLPGLRGGGGDHRPAAPGHGPGHRLPVPGGRTVHRLH